MCQMIVFWHSCGHLYASYLQCPFKELDRHEDNFATAANVDVKCWACKMTECPVTKQLKTTLLTVEHLEIILGESSTDPGFLESVIGFYAHGDHSRYWDQPGPRKAEYVLDDPYMEDMEDEAYLEAAARTGEFAGNAGFAFDLEIAQAARNDPQNHNNLNWFARGAYSTYPFYYQLSDKSVFQPPGNVPRPEPRDAGEVRRPLTLPEESLHKRPASNPRYGNTTTLGEDSLLASAFHPDDGTLSTENSPTSEIPQLSNNTTGPIQNDPAFDDLNNMLVPMSANVNNPMSNGVESSAENNLAVHFQGNVVVPTQSDVADPLVDPVTSFVPNATTPSFSNGATIPFLERLIDSMQNGTASPTQGELISIQTNAVAPIQENEKHIMDYEYTPRTTTNRIFSYDTELPIEEDNANDLAIDSPKNDPELPDHGHSSTGAQREGEHFNNQQPQDPQQHQNAFVSYQAYYQFTHSTPTSTAGAFPELSMDSTSPELPPTQHPRSQFFSGLDDVGDFMLDNVSMDGNPPSSDTIEDWSTIYDQDSVGDVMQDDDREAANEAYSQTEE
ncbi:hypothetical protein P168DRAFT_278744 [Aspergillus campestris IBT 28561]|uniref:Uncharacterized protein n=1 Tax=Aspergillus campestris (strain IBT 28561) TaxID=1392248 RepID=A0A2I1DH89_ASPC2|nr:uncharacterized protein P168DRAFT_278744 [Aspergillus campestris IBT 28561]PKY09242.1 hypothetical protein P168DRAFT_278744 [Aspergillus campestris IBT 28561]